MTGFFFSRPQHIGVLCTSWPHTNRPSAGRFVYSLTEALILRGHSVTALFAARGDGEAEALSGCALTPIHLGSGLFAHASGAPEQLFAKSNQRAKIQAIAFSSALLAGAVLQLRDCTALISHFALPCGLVAGAIRGKRPHHAIVHGSDALVLQQIPNRVRSQFFNGSTSIQCAHPGLRHGWPALSVPLLDLPMGWTPGALTRQQARSQCQLNDDTVVVLCIARCIEIKGLSTLLAAAKQLSSHTNVRFWILGDGPMRAALEASAPSNTHFFGELSPIARDRLLAAADLYVQPSVVIDNRTDSAPTALVEAMGAGLASVVTSVGALAWLTAKSALVVPPGDIEALTSALKELIENPGLRAELATIARERASGWQWAQLAEKIEPLLCLGT